MTVAARPRFLGWAPGDGPGQEPALEGGGPQAGSFEGPTLPPAELEALVCKEAERVLQAREQEEVEEVDQAEAA